MPARRLNLDTTAKPSFSQHFTSHDREPRLRRGRRRVRSLRHRHRRESLTARIVAIVDRLQSVKKEHLHVSFASVAADGWQHNASFRDQAWRLARFFDRVSQGSLMAYIPTIRCKTAALLIRTSETHRAEFRGWLAQLSDKALDVEPVDFGASAVYENLVATHIIEGVSHFTMVTTGASDIAKLVGRSLNA
eukprot:m.238141 g.238141  ORF g.238141 m.238141 type:complete len:191 (+) comp15805_c0_seq1:505-1077(+)